MEKQSGRGKVKEKERERSGLVQESASLWYWVPPFLPIFSKTTAINE